MVTRSLGQPMSRETIWVGARVLCVGSQVFVPVTDERFVCPQTLNISGQKKTTNIKRLSNSVNELFLHSLKPKLCEYVSRMYLVHRALFIYKGLSYNYLVVKLQSSS